MMISLREALGSAHRKTRADQNKQRQMSTSEGVCVRVHNKSGKRLLSILDAPCEQIEEALQYVRSMAITESRLASSDCRLLPSPADGRFTKNGIKRFYFYQAVALDVFGRQEMMGTLWPQRSRPTLLCRICAEHETVLSHHICC
uniref:Uncharacterized protein n=1 Tax=Erythrolobus australicus TaxID=1077150 RepID=A0A7S1TJQ9_9RHOD|mmetsp:Transcript_178/g.460  ORF Transcript_178/g.460 Transcript_178/m.460 type:complete len:144 (+) Transcript_178:148-579(+)